MSARQRQTERVVAPRLDLPDWTGVLSRTDTITGHLICSMTGWRLALTATADRDTIYVTAQFDGPLMADDAAPWTDDYEIAKPHQRRSAGYDCFWTGFMKRLGNDWAGEIGDRYGGRLMLTGKTQREGVISLRATAQMAEEVRE